VMRNSRCAELFWSAGNVTCVCTHANVHRFG